MATTDKILLLRVPEQWLEDRKAELAQHPLYGSLSEYLVNMVDCGVAALNAPHACTTCARMHEPMDSENCYPCMQRGEDHWECAYLRKEAEND